MFLTAENLSVLAVHKQLQNVYDINMMPECTIYISGYVDSAGKNGKIFTMVKKVVDRETPHNATSVKDNHGKNHGIRLVCFLTSRQFSQSIAIRLQSLSKNETIFWRQRGCERGRVESSGVEMAPMAGTQFYMDRTNKLLLLPKIYRSELRLYSKLKIIVIFG